jgi:arginase
VIALISAPTNLGLRPPQPGSVPGADKAPAAFREAGLFARLASHGARGAGVVLAGRYVDDDGTRSPGHVRNEAALVAHARLLGARIAQTLRDGEHPVVIGGDCSVLVGIGLGLAAAGSTGLVHIDGHTDFRHPGNSDACASVAGEDLAAAVGLHWPAISDIDGHGPYFPAARCAHIGHRDDDEHLDEVVGRLGLVLSARASAALDADALAATVLDTTGPGYWLQVDVDVLDPSVMPAVDSPDAGGLMSEQLSRMLTALAPQAIGASITVFDPDLDPDGRYARLLTDILVPGLALVGSSLGT